MTEKGFTVDPMHIKMDLEELEMELIDGGLEELENDKEAVTIYTDFSDFSNMTNLLEEMGIEVKMQVQRIPNNFKAITNEQATLVLKLLDKLRKMMTYKMYSIIWK